MKEEKKYSIADLLDKLVGSTEPYGESNHDSKALDNLDDVDKVLGWATDRLRECRQSRNNYQASMISLARKAREIAQCYIETFEAFAEMSEKESERESK